MTEHWNSSEHWGKYKYIITQEVGLDKTRNPLGKTFLLYYQIRFKSQLSFPIHPYSQDTGLPHLFFKKHDLHIFRRLIESSHKSELTVRVQHQAEDVCSNKVLRMKAFIFGAETTARWYTEHTLSTHNVSV